jgi:hypothetical protein
MTNKSRQDSFNELNIVSGPRAMRRARNMSALTCRGSIESGAGEESAENLRIRISRWIAGLDLGNEIEARENEVIHASLGSLAEKDAIEATWSAEALSIVAWALRASPMPTHDEKADPYGSAESVGFLDDHANEFILSAAPRASDELIAYREIAYAVHCRLNDFLRNGRPKDFSSWIEPIWTEQLGVQRTSFLANGDLSIRGAAIAEAPIDVVQECEWITHRRHKAIVWLTNASNVYSAARADT